MGWRKRKVGSKIASQGRVTRSEKEERQEAAACAPAQIQNGAAPSGAMPTAEREAGKKIRTTPRGSKVYA